MANNFKEEEQKEQVDYTLSNSKLADFRRFKEFLSLTQRGFCFCKMGFGLKWRPVTFSPILCKNEVAAKGKLGTLLAQICTGKLRNSLLIFAAYFLAQSSPL